MKNTLVAIIGLTTLLAAPNLFAAYDGTIVLTQNKDSVTGYSYGNGGEFRGTTTANGGAPELGTFHTFCLEGTEYFNPDGLLYYKINTGAVNGGGNAGNGSPVVAGYDPLSIGTAFLYSTFRAGNLYDTTTFGTTRMANAGELQAALWFLEDEGGSLSTSMIAALTAGLGTPGVNYINWKQDSQGAYGVVALNVYYDAGMTQKAQDQLAIVPEPSTIIAAALLLLPFGASTIRILRKNRIA